MEVAPVAIIPWPCAEDPLDLGVHRLTCDLREKERGSEDRKMNEIRMHQQKNIMIYCCNKTSIVVGCRSQRLYFHDARQSSQHTSRNTLNFSSLPIISFVVSAFVCLFPSQYNR